MSLDLETQLLECLNNSSMDSTDFLITNTVLKNKTIIADLSIDDLAELCHVSPPTISRFCKKMSCENFLVFKKNMLTVGNHINYSLYHMEKHSYKKLETQPENFLISYAQQIAETLIESAESIDLLQMDTLIAEINRTENVYFFGRSTSLSMLEMIQTNLLNSGKIIYYGSSISQQHAQAANLASSDLAIVISCFGNFVNFSSDIISKLSKSKAKLILITQNYHLSGSNLFDSVIYLSKKNNIETGNYSMQLGIEYLVRRYSALYS